jgi:PhzF family phenazine biosynthesis protein
VLDASGLSDAEMLAIAAEVGYSETAFVVSRAPAVQPPVEQPAAVQPPPPPPQHLGGPSKAAEPDTFAAPSTAPEQSTALENSTARAYRVRYFSPEIEVDFCGHATIATAAALGPGDHVFLTNAGEVPVTVDQEQRATLTSVPPSIADLLPGDLGELLKALRYTETDLDETLPPQVAYAGAYHPVIALSDRSRLAALDYDVDALKDLMTARGWITIQLVHRVADDTFDVRNPFPVGGVYEDPATGAAAAALGGYLRALGKVADDATITINQGHDLGRPSRITVTLTPGEPGIRVSGTAVPITG